MEQFAIGADIGGTNLRVAAYAEDKGLLEIIRVNTRREDGPEAVMADLCEAVRTLWSRFHGTFYLRGVGIATPGPMELPGGRLLELPNLPGWEGFELLYELEKRLETNVVVENDANVAALAECVLGQGKQSKADSLCMLTLGTGVGSGIVLGGEIWHGMNGMAGEAGHISVQESEEICSCGTRGCLELYASATGLIRIATERIASAPGIRALSKCKPEFTSNDLFELAMSGDSDAKDIFQAMGRAMGKGLSSLVNTLNLPIYVIGGGVAKAWPLFSTGMFEELYRGSSIYRLTDPDQRPRPVMAKAKTQIVAAQLGPDAGILGACLLAISSSYKPKRDFMML